MSREFTFRISMSVLDHLGRNLYRSFATVLGEAISNAWDADAQNVWIYIDKAKDSFFVKDDGVGMTDEDFQSKFLKIGYTKRLGGHSTSQGGRPYIGRKGIGKLALLSCAKKIHVISKKQDGEIIGGVIDNADLDRAITDDVEPDNYKLSAHDLTVFAEYTREFEHGTIIYFDKIEDGIRKRLESIRRIIALYFRFSLLDDSFNIFLEDQKITLEDLSWLSGKTQFLWKLGTLADPFVDERLKPPTLKESTTVSTLPNEVQGFIASVVSTHDLKLEGSDERVGVDLFVNGRLRERDILRHLPLPRIAVNYLYGQIHFNALDDDKDRFATSREGIVAEDPKFAALLESLKPVLKTVLSDWDKWRRKHRETGDSENASITKKDRASGDLYNAVVTQFIPPDGSGERERIDEWVSELQNDATFNFGSYGECFVSENLVRKLLRSTGAQISADAQAEITRWQGIEAANKRKGNLNIDIRKDNDFLSYLDMGLLAGEADVSGALNTIQNDAKEYKPIRDALAHTARLTEVAKHKLTSVYENIKGRIKTLLASAPQTQAPTAAGGVTQAQDSVDNT